ncbi:bactofilin family protein [Alkaliphilus serpentinus]|uniref:Polymer-forming cytoskeletal protein n=1 Tax=Alkaliphilus serpentinus TaxID=1482731 RepID=A0A833HNP6_9FIRM|nr:polymer-forming cytoskeletal protein [Alkaliphilus serpentinus]KAB3529032.1 polymer-forming cytoskeletal protein [Alkaliphilus serpentinus]
MLGKKQEVQYTKFNTLIGAECSFEGRLNIKGTIRVEGEFKGEINIDGNLYIGESGRIIGNINSTNVFVAGTVEGNVNASGQLRIASKGKLFGDVDISNFILDEDAIFEGSCKMKRNGIPAKEEIRD